MFRHVWFNTCKAVTIDAETEKKRIRENTYYIGLQGTPQNEQAPVLFPDTTFCCHQ